MLYRQHANETLKLDIQEQPAWEIAEFERLWKVAEESLEHC